MLKSHKKSQKTLFFIFIIIYIVYNIHYKHNYILITNTNKVLSTDQTSFHWIFLNHLCNFIKIDANITLVFIKISPEKLIFLVPILCIFPISNNNCYFSTKYKKINIWFCLKQFVILVLFADFIDHFEHHAVARVGKNVRQKSSLRDRCKNSWSQMFPINIPSRRLTPNMRSDSASRFSTSETGGKKQTSRARIGNVEKAKKVITVTISSAIFARTTQAKFIRNQNKVFDWSVASISVLFFLSSSGSVFPLRQKVRNDVLTLQWTTSSRLRDLLGIPDIFQDFVANLLTIIGYQGSDTRSIWPDTRINQFWQQTLDPGLNICRVG